MQQKRVTMGWLMFFALALPLLMARGADAANVECRAEYTSQNARLELCRSKNQSTLVRLNWQQKANQPPTVIKALFDSNSSKVWKTLAVTSGEAVIDGKAQLALREEIFKFGPQNLDPRAHAVIDFVANFAAAGTSLNEFDPKFTDHLLAMQNIGPLYNLICDHFGKARDATFALGDKQYQKTYVVGEGTSLCPGRCGMGCYQIFQWRGAQYTQECLNHDACTEMTSSVLGPCQWSFIQAAIGYLLAPNCSLEQKQPEVKTEQPASSEQTQAKQASSNSQRPSLN